MAVPTRSYNFTNGSVADADQVDTELNSLFDYLAAGGSPNNSVYKQLLAANGLATHTSLTTTKRVFTGDGAIVAQTAVGSSVPLLYLDDADYAVTGKTTVLRLRAQVVVIGTGTAPAVTLTVGLYPITAPTSTDLLTIGTVVTGLTVAFASPAQPSINTGVSGDVTIPSDGYYALGIVASGSAASGSSVYVSAQLQTRHV